MKSQARKHISVFLSRRRAALLSMVAVAGLFASACAVQETNTYPVEIFSEMHYAQSYGSQEPPRLQPLPGAVVFDSAGGPGEVLDVPVNQRTEYDPARAEHLYMVNCSVCHGVSGMGNGPAAAHLTSDGSFYATESGQPYGPPPNLQDTRQRLNEQTVFGIVDNGIVVMPRFGGLMSEEEIWQIVSYIFDTQNGLGAGQ